MSPIDNILQAASIISSSLPNVNVDDLLPRHRQELESVFYILGQTLGSPSSHRQNSPEAPDPEYSSAQPHKVSTPGQTEACTPTRGLRRQADSPGHLDDQTPPSSVPKAPSKQDGAEKTDAISSLMSALQRSSEKIRTFVAMKPDDAVSRCTNWTVEDPRLVDIDLIEPDKSQKGRFRAWLARYSLATDYLAWAESEYKLPREKFLGLDEKAADNKNQGHISKYVSLFGWQGEKAYKAIRHGLKFISFEHIYGNPGVSVFLCHVFRLFRDLPHSQFKSLEEAIRKSSEWSELAKSKAEWLSNCQSIYDQDIAHFQAQKLNRKRPLELEWTSVPSQHKRVEITNSAPTAGHLSSDALLNPSRHSDLDIYQQPSEDGDEQRSEQNNLRPNFDFWGELNVPGLDIWREDFGLREEPLLPFAQAEEVAGEVDNTTSNQENMRLERSVGSQEDGCRQNVWQVTDGHTVNLPLFKAPATQTAC